MDNTSNRILAIILLLAILISFGGTLVGMTRLTQITGAKAPRVFEPLINAMVTATATVNLSVTETTDANWTPTNLSWGSGQVDVGTKGCIIDSMGKTGSTTNCSVDPFGSVTTGLNLTNIGNTNLSVNISLDKNAQSFIGGTDASAKWNASDALGQLCSGPCICTVAKTFGQTWQAFSTTATPICNATDMLRPIIRNNTLRFDFEFMIPYDTGTGLKASIITATFAKV